MLNSALRSADLSEQQQSVSSVEYSGQAKEGLDTNASFDRLIYQDRKKIYTRAELFDLVGGMYQNFRESRRSRMVLRVLADPGIDSTQLARLSSLLMENAEIDFYPDSEGRFNYLTVSINRKERAVDGDNYRGITDAVQSRVDRVMQSRNSFEEEALRNLANASEKGFQPTLDIQVDELTKIWEPFGWSREAVANLLTAQTKDVVMGMRNRLGELMAVVMYNDQSHNGIRNGETTEWTTVPEYRGHGIIQPLLINMHGYLLSKGVGNIWADLRTPDPKLRLPNSIEPALRSGMKLFHADEHRYISSNHVTIEGQAQSYNADSDQMFGDVPRNQLRSFVRGWVDRGQFTDKLINETLNNLSTKQ